MLDVSRLEVGHASVDSGAPRSTILTGESRRLSAELFVDGDDDDDERHSAWNWLLCLCRCVSP